MSKRRAIAYVLMFCLVMKHLWSNEYGAFDRFLEIIVVVLIAIEGIVPLINWWRRKRKSRRLFELVLRADDLHHSVPKVEQSQSVKEQWVRTASQWTQDTTKCLQAYSIYALHFFQRNEGVDISADISNFHQDEEIRSAIRSFGYRWQNLNQIMGERSQLF